MIQTINFEILLIQSIKISFEITNLKLDEKHYKKILFNSLNYNPISNFF